MGITPIGTPLFYNAEMRLKDPIRLAISEYPDQTAPGVAVRSGSALFAQTNT